VTQDAFGGNYYFSSSELELMFSSLLQIPSRQKYNLDHIKAALKAVKKGKVLMQPELSMSQR
jgi:hypothetical protein